MVDEKLESLWNSLPIGRENAITYDQLVTKWGIGQRAVRETLHDLSLYDNGDDFILIRSGSAKGFYKTNDLAEIFAFKRECISKGKSIFAPVKKINRVISVHSGQLNILNNLRLKRQEAGLKQSEVVMQMQKIDPSFDAPLLSKLENGVCLPNPNHAAHLAVIYGCDPSELTGECLYI